VNNGEKDTMSCTDVQDVTKEFLEQEKLWKQKSILINEYFRDREEPIRSETKRKVKKECEWCERFKKCGFFHCLHCGSALK